MQKHFSFLLLLLSLSVQQVTARSDEKELKPFGALNLAVTAGSTGIGFEFSSPLHKKINLRAGFSYMPKINPVMTFNVEGRSATGKVTSFESMANKLQQFIGYEVDDEIDMKGEPTFYNFNILADFHIFKSKNWYLTAGVYFGPNEIAHAYNKTEEMPSLLAVGMYNMMYDKAHNDEPLISDVYLDPYDFPSRMGIYVGDYKDGTPYMMEPDKNGMVKVRMKTSTCIRPYLGFGYGGRLIKGDDRCYVSFDCGAMYWGGVPEVLTHDGVDLTRDLRNIRGQVNDYVKIVKNFPVYPVLNFKISYKLF